MKIETFFYSSMLSHRYQEELKDSLYDDVDDELRHQFFDWFHKYENSIEASDSWYETSCRSLPEYWICEGDHLLNWRDKGYVTLFDLLQVKILFVSTTCIFTCILLLSFQ